MVPILAVLQAVSFSVAVFVVGVGYALIQGNLHSSASNTPIWIAAAVAVAAVPLIRGYHWWKWSLPGPRVASILLAVGHACLLVALALFSELVERKDVGLLAFVPALCCVFTYPPGVLAIAISMLKEFQRVQPTVRAGHLQR